MKRAAVRSIACLGVVLLLLCLSACGEGPSKKEAKAVIGAHIKDCYGLVVPSRFVYYGPPTSRYWNIALAKDLNLIDATAAASAGYSAAAVRTLETIGDGDRFDITLTDKGKATAHLEGHLDYIVFLVSGNTVEEIVSIEKGDAGQFPAADGGADQQPAATQGGAKQQYVVKFSFVSKYNDFGKTAAAKTKEYHLDWPDDNTKVRGKALLAYDEFTKKYVVKGIMISKWDKEDWRYPVWFADYIGKRFFYHNLEGAPQPTMVAIEQAAMTRNEMNTALSVKATQEFAKMREMHIKDRIIMQDRKVERAIEREINRAERRKQRKMY